MVQAFSGLFHHEDWFPIVTSVRDSHLRSVWDPTPQAAVRKQQHANYASNPNEVAGTVAGEVIPRK